MMHVCIVVPESFLLWNFLPPATKQECNCVSGISNINTSLLFRQEEFSDIGPHQLLPTYVKQLCQTHGKFYAQMSLFTHQNVFWSCADVCWTCLCCKKTNVENWNRGRRYLALSDFYVKFLCFRRRFQCINVCKSSHLTKTAYTPFVYSQTM